MSDFKVGDVVLIKEGGWGIDPADEGKYLKIVSIGEKGVTGEEWGQPLISSNDSMVYDVWFETFGKNPMILLNTEKSLLLEEHPLESYPSKQSALETRKDDKNMMHLVDTGFPNALLALGEVMSWAARNKGYLPNDWKDIPEPFDAFLGAASRHRNKRLASQERDDESGLYHLAHEAFNVLAQLELKMLGKLDD